jgi:hypothetical protein
MPWETEKMRPALMLAAMLLGSCAPAEQSAAPAPAAPTAASVHTPGQAPAAAAGQPAAVTGGTILACTPVEGRPPSAAQSNLAMPFFLRLDDSGRPVRFEGGTLPVRIPFQVSKIEPAVGMPGLRVGAMIHYAAKDAQHEMYTALAIMQDGSYRIGVMLKVPPQTAAALAYSAHGTCVAKPA